MLQDFHLVGGSPGILEMFHKEYNEDKDAKVTEWEPAVFADAKDNTKRRTVTCQYKMRAPSWLLKLIGMASPS